MKRLDEVVLEYLKADGFEPEQEDAKPTLVPPPGEYEKTIKETKPDGE